MRKIDRLFDIIQMLRAANRPLTAGKIAGRLEVSKRTVYRDIAVLQAARIPLEGAAGLGYVLRSGYDMPPIGFDPDEAQAAKLGLELVARTGDHGLTRAARRALDKLPLCRGDTILIAMPQGAAFEQFDALPQVRRAIQLERKIHIYYTSGEGRSTERVIWPLIILFYPETPMLVAWCELRQALRHFRFDRLGCAKTLADQFEGQGVRLRCIWTAQGQDQMT